MMQQTIRPAGAGHETLLVLALCAAIMATSAAVIAMRTHKAAPVIADAGVLDARHDLNAAEQGIYADLRVAHDEITAENKPAIAALAEAGLQPFAQDASSARRGGHRWERLQNGETIAYLGTSADESIAGSMLLRLAADSRTHEHAAAGDEAEVWLNRSSALSVPLKLEAADLTRAGWRKVVAQFDAGVTRASRHL